MTRGVDPFDRLTPFGWRGGVAMALLLSLVSFLLVGYFTVYWRNADMDFMVIYNALAMNDGGAQVFFDHPAYLTILSVKAWFAGLHRLGLLDAWTLSAIPPASDRAAFDAAMTSAVHAGRVAALLTAAGILIAFAVLARCLVSDWRIAMFAMTAFTFSGGVQMHLRILRSEMIAASFCILSLMLLIVVARHASNARPLVIGLAAMLCMLGLTNKVHAILLVAAIPVLVLPFGSERGASAAFWRTSRAWAAVLVAALAAIIAASAAWPLLAAGFDPANATAAGLKPLLLGRFGIYQLALLGVIAACMVLYARLWRVSAAETLVALLMAVAGASLGLLSLDLSDDINDVVVVLNPLEKMITYVDAPEAAGSLSGAIGLLLSGLLGVIRRYTFVLQPSARPTVFLIWLIIPGIVVALRRGERQVALQAALLMLAVIGIDTLGVRRGLKVEYFVLTDPLIIIAGVILLERLADVSFSRFAYPIGATLLVLHVGISQAEPVKMALKRQGPETVCEWHDYYMPRLELPWCPPASPPRS
ncbi:conserved membrane protein of unknown function [Bradyrhizobium sp. ORS 285]|uniref:hypothetical protein n=1 Tax=Bradyrhizobium sp. ORS 285 TaxID=115808 RepID=UPI0002407900|nr:hypothetical protein [Bradyrhizobium sp. ORS 285]CCD87922.1 conserved membrane hypothetical protein [Bradyrhizobium sp. ORS 285]SMX61801.1 conserved membrane protein of unknown function [Bradyrhizobium sp. ORS 285]